MNDQSILVAKVFSLQPAKEAKPGLWLVYLLYVVVAIAQQELGGLAAEQIKSVPWPNTGVGN